MTHSFADDLAFSHAQTDQPWWEEVYRQAFPDLVGMACVRNDGWAQRGGIDRVLTLASGKTLTIDEKVRRKDYGDILLEYWSDEERRIKGWIAKDLACDYIAYATVPNQLCYLLPFQELRRVWRRHHREWVATYKPPIRSENTHYVTVGVAVPAHVLLTALTASSVFSWAKVAA